MNTRDLIKNPSEQDIDSVFRRFKKELKKEKLRGKTFSFSFFKTDTGASFKILLLRTPKKRTNGFTSYCTDGKHVPLFDFDNNSYEEVVTELFLLQQAKKLSEIYIFKNDSENSFAAFCLDKFELFDVVRIISQTSADKAFKGAPLRYGMKRWVYRYDSKGKRKPPVHIATLKAHKQAIAQKSNAHRLLFNTVFDMRIKKNKGFDNFTTIDLYSYLTSNHLKPRKTKNFK